jgi:UbiD family decarboxylase
MAYQDLRAYLAALERAGRLHRIAREVDKDWEIAAVCRKAFQNVPTAMRPALLFEHVRGYDMPVVAGVLGASPTVYALALQTSIENVSARWAAALQQPIPPTLVAEGVCQERVLTGDAATLHALPVPVWTVGEDPGPFLTAPYVFSQDPDTGARNVGTYRIQLNDGRCVGIACAGKHVDRHLAKYRERGERMPVAIVMGTDPALGLASVTSVPFGVDECAVAGGLRGAPIELVPCKTIPLAVPATAEIVIEGEMDPTCREQEGPFGEYTGYMGAAGLSPVIEITAITHRANPIYQVFVSQTPPSESSCIRMIGREQALLQHLRAQRLPVTDVHFKESGASGAYLVIAVRREGPDTANEVIAAAWAHEPSQGKITVVVDDDIDIRDSAAVEWAMSFHMQPGQDVSVHTETEAVGLDPSIAPRDVPHHVKRQIRGSKLAIDATRKHAFPARALPPREHLQRVEAQWADYGPW